MNFKTILEKIFPLFQKEKIEKLASLNTFITIPSRKDFKDKPEVLTLLDSYKEKFIKILCSKRIIMSQDLELENLYQSSQMLTQLLHKLINEEDCSYLFSKVFYYQVGTKKLTYISKMSKLKAYLYDLNQLYLKTKLQIIALEEILEEKHFLSSLKKNSIKEEINNLTCTILIIENQTRAINLGINKYLDTYTMLNDEEFVSNQDMQLVINEKCNELRKMISLLLPKNIEDLNVNENNITNLVFMEMYLEEYIYNHKNEVENLKKEISDETIVINMERVDAVSYLNNLEIKLKAFALYGYNLITENDFKNFYTIKFAFETKDIMKSHCFSMKEITHIEDECYTNIISKKISNILTGKNIFWNKFFANNANASRNFTAFLKANQKDFDYLKILTSPNLLGLVVAFDCDKGLEEYFANIRVHKKYYPQVNLHENTYHYIRKFKDEYFEQKIETYDKKFFEFADYLSLETIFKMAYYNEQDIKEPLYQLFKMMFVKNERENSTFQLPEGLIQINIPKENLFNGDRDIITKWQVLARNKDFKAPSTLVEINSPLLKNVYLNDVYLNIILKKISEKAFMGLNARSIHIPPHLKEIDESVFENASIKNIYFHNFIDLEPIFFNIIHHFFIAIAVGEKKYHFISNKVKEKQKKYRNGHYSTFLDNDLFDHDSTYQDCKLKFKNCSQIILKCDNNLTVAFNVNDINITSSRDLTYHAFLRKSPPYQVLDNGVKAYPITEFEADKIYDYLKNAMEEEIIKKKVIDKK